MSDVSLSARSRRREREREQGRRRPLVLAATLRAQKQAASLGVVGVLENAVTAAIAAGRLVGHARVGGITHVRLDDGFTVEVLRVEAASGRKAWIPIGINRINPVKETRR